MSMTQDFIDMLIKENSESYINEISKEEFESLVKDKTPMRICDYYFWKDIESMNYKPFPLLKVFEIVTYSDCYGESWFNQIVFKYKGKYYEYIEQG